MPSSYRENIPQVLAIIEEVKPKTILDVGFGRGKYGFLVREYFPGVMIDGVEVFNRYVTKLHESIYRSVITANALILRPKNYDLILLIDVVEHWTKTDAKTWIRTAIEDGAKVLVSTPVHDIPQGPVNGNEWERHISHWSVEDFAEFPHKQYENPLSLTLLLGV